MPLIVWGVFFIYAITEQTIGAIMHLSLSNPPPPPQYELCGALGEDLNLNFAPRGREFEQALSFIVVLYMKHERTRDKTAAPRVSLSL